MTLNNPKRKRLTALATGLALVTAVGTTSVLVNATGAHAISGKAGTNTVDVNPTTGLVDSQAVTITATAAAGQHLAQMRVHICTPTAVVTQIGDYQDSPNCLPIDQKLSPGSDSEVDTLGLDNTTVTTHTVTFKVGVGSQSWTTLYGDAGTLTTGPGKPAQLVVEVVSTDQTSGAAYFGAPISFGSATTTTTAAPTTTTSTTAPTTTTTAPTTTTTTTAPTTTTTTTAPTTTTSTTAGPTTTSTTAPTTTTTTAPTTTTTAPTTTTSTTAPTTTTSTTTGPTTTTSTTAPTTTTTAPTTSTTAPATSTTTKPTTTTTAPSTTTTKPSTTTTTKPSGGHHHHNRWRIFIRILRWLLWNLFNCE